MNTGKIILGLLAGVAAGAALGILLAPNKGSITRKRITDMADDLSSDIKENVSESIKTFTDQFENAEVDAKGLVNKGKSKLKDGYNKFVEADHHSDYLSKA